jgi:hypothetical protein
MKKYASEEMRPPADVSHGEIVIRLRMLEDGLTDLVKLLRHNGIIPKREDSIRHV